MLLDHEEKSCPEGYKEAFDIHKIQGYHYLTAKMQHTLNQKFLQSFKNIQVCHENKIQI